MINNAAKTAGAVARQFVNEITAQDMRGQEVTQVAIALALLDIADALRELVDKP